MRKNIVSIIKNILEEIRFSKGKVGFAKIYQLMEEDRQYFLSHKDELLKNYNDKYVAIRDGAVVGHSERWDDLVEYVNKNNIGRVYIEKVEENSFREKSNLEILLPVFG